MIFYEPMITNACVQSQLMPLLNVKIIRVTRLVACNFGELGLDLQAKLKLKTRKVHCILISEGEDYVLAWAQNAAYLLQIN